MIRKHKIEYQVNITKGTYSKTDARIIRGRNDFLRQNSTEGKHELQFRRHVNVRTVYVLTFKQSSCTFYKKRTRGISPFDKNGS